MTAEVRELAHLLAGISTASSSEANVRAQGVVVLSAFRVTAVIREALIVGTLKPFDVEDDSIPTNVLWAEIVKHPRAATPSSASAWERLVGDVF